MSVLCNFIAKRIKIGIQLIFSERKLFTFIVIVAF